MNNNELTKMNENNSRVQEVYETLASRVNQPTRCNVETVLPEAKVKKIKIEKYLTKNPFNSIPAYGAIHFEGGHIYVTDGNKVIRVRADYPIDKEGKSFTKKGDIMDIQYIKVETFDRLCKDFTEKYVEKIDTKRVVEAFSKFKSDYNYLPNQYNMIAFVIPVTDERVSIRHSIPPFPTERNKMFFDIKTLDGLQDLYKADPQIEAFLSGGMMHVFGSGIYACYMSIFPQELNDYNSAAYFNGKVYTTGGVSQFFLDLTSTFATQATREGKSKAAARLQNELAQFSKVNADGLPIKYLIER